MSNYGFSSYNSGYRPLVQASSTDRAKVSKTELPETYDLGALKAYGFTDADIKKYFKSLEVKGTLGDGTKITLNSDRYQLKENLVINGKEIKTLNDLREALKLDGSMPPETIVPRKE